MVPEEENDGLLDAERHQARHTIAPRAQLFPVAEKFVSVNGEGLAAGRPAAFIRFAGCNMWCTYCDTRWANHPLVEVEGWSVPDLAAWVAETGVSCVTLTGGEPLLQPYLPGQVDPNLCAVDPVTGIQYRNIAPGEKGFIWGSNAIGQDLWARIWAGARTSLTIAFFVALIEAVVGITVGVLWGYVRQLDFFFTELYNICDNVPSTIILILISYVASPSVQTLILGMSITGWIAMARFIRNQILIIRDRDYNVASRCIGTPTSRIVVRNLLPYLVSVIMLRMALTIPAAIGSEVFITYIGLGLSVEVPSLGNLINDGRKVMMQAGLRYQLLYPTIILSFVTIAFYLIGNAFSDAADPKNHLQ